MNITFCAFFAGAVIVSGMVCVQAEETTEGRDSAARVVLLHGLGRSSRSMNKMAAYLEDQGYDTVNIDYPSTRLSIEDIVNRHITPEINALKSQGQGPIHFVTHSLGGILLRQYLQTETLPQGSRAVLLAPPNHGSELADALKPFALYKWSMGPAGQQLGTDASSIPTQLKPITMEIGVITGDRDGFPVFSHLFSGKNDGKVSVESAKLEEMKAFKVVHCGHTFIMTRKDVLKDVAHFLSTGGFIQDTPPSVPDK